MMFEKYFAFAMAAIILALPSPAETAVLATLAGDKVTVAFDVNATSVHFAVTTTEARAKWVAIGIGTQMINTHSYVAWFDDAEVGHLDSYWMTSHSPGSVKKVEGEELTEVVVEKNSEGLVSFSFRRPLKGKVATSGDEIPTITLSEDLPLVWVLGERWTGAELSWDHFHFAQSIPVTLVSLDIPTGDGTGDTLAVVKITSSVEAAYTAHGWLMFMGWGIMVPAGVFSSRFLKHLKDGLWLKLHKGFMALALLLMSVGLIVVVKQTEDKHLRHFDNSHTKYGMAALCLGFLQPINAFLRPHKPEPAPKGEEAPAKLVVTPRRAWEVGHRVVAMASVVVAVVALSSGLHQIREKGLQTDTEDNLRIALGVWVALLVALPVARAVQVAYMPARKPDASLEDGGGDKSVDMAAMQPKPLSP